MMSVVSTKTVALWDNRSAAPRRWNVPRPLTHSSDSTREQAPMNATRVCPVPDCTVQHSQGRPDLGHTIEQRFWVKVDRRGPDECWPWLASKTHGHGQFIVMGDNGRGHPVYAHRMAYTLLVGPIPDGMFLDHLCHTNDPECEQGGLCSHRACVNPAHLEPVTLDENTARGRWAPIVNAVRTHCQRGHEFTPENTYITPKRGVRQCRECMHMRDRGRKR